MRLGKRLSKFEVYSTVSGHVPMLGGLEGVCWTLAPATGHTGRKWNLSLSYLPLKFVARYPSLNLQFTQSNRCEETVYRTGKNVKNAPSKAFTEKFRMAFKELP